MGHASDFKTSDRIKGMLTVALSETEAPLYFSPSKMASLFNATCPPISTFGSALLNAGYEISRTRCRRFDQDERAEDVCARRDPRVDQNEPGHDEECQGRQSGQ